MSVLVNFRIDEQLKMRMDKVCKDLGITMSAAFNMFANDLVKSKNINFSLNKKLKSGIDFNSLFEKISGDSEGDKYYVNKIGNIIMLVPKNDPWAGIKDSAGKMSDDYMIDRKQMPNEVREKL